MNRTKALRLWAVTGFAQAIAPPGTGGVGHQEKGRRGWSIKRSFSGSTTPSARNKEASRSLLDRAATPPVQEGRSLAFWDASSRSLMRLLSLLAASVGATLVAGSVLSLPARVQSPPAGSTIRYVDVTRAAGLTFRHNSGASGKKYLPESL